MTFSYQWRELIFVSDGRIATPDVCNDFLQDDGHKLNVDSQC